MMSKNTKLNILLVMLITSLLPALASIQERGDMSIVEEPMFAEAINSNRLEANTLELTQGLRFAASNPFVFGLRAIDASGQADGSTLVVDANGELGFQSVAANALVPTSPIVNAQIVNDAITNIKITDDAVGSPLISGGIAIVSKIADNAVSANKLQDNSIARDNIFLDSITADKMNSTSFVLSLPHAGFAPILPQSAIPPITTNTSFESVLDIVDAQITNNKNSMIGKIDASAPYFNKDLTINGDVVFLGDIQIDGSINAQTIASNSQNLSLANNLGRAAPTVRNPTQGVTTIPPNGIIYQTANDQTEIAEALDLANLFHTVDRNKIVLGQNTPSLTKGAPEWNAVIVSAIVRIKPDGIAQSCDQVCENSLGICREASRRTSGVFRTVDCATSSSLATTCTCFEAFTRFTS